MRKNTYLAIEGVIGVGKTTLAHLIHREFAAKLLYDPCLIIDTDRLDFVHNPSDLNEII